MNIDIKVPTPVPIAFESFGDHHMQGPEGVRFYTKLETMTARWPIGIRAGADFNIPTM